MHAELANLNHCAVPFLSRAADNLSRIKYNIFNVIQYEISLYIRSVYSTRAFTMTCKRQIISCIILCILCIILCILCILCDVKGALYPTVTPP